MITDRQAQVHVSGHPGRPELAAMYRWIRPEIIVPVHGEMRHMAEHARFARREGMPHGIVQMNGDLVRLAPDGPKKLGEEKVGRLILDGDVILAADGSTMNERRQIALLRHRSRWRWRWTRAAVCRAASEVALQGIPVEEDREAFLEEACDAAADAARRAARQRRQAARGGPPRRPPLRDRMDRQEAGGRRARRRGLSAMKLQSLLAIYILFWTISLFVVLPFGVRTAEEEGVECQPGHAPSAPHRFSFGKAALRATIVSAIAFASFWPITTSAG